ncbi:MAG: hypothetical protein NTZ35_01340 [Ignavibacteriales bacterium]|nr:hypothetical protein [Ignavibacteriales bacterium]
MDFYVDDNPETITAVATLLRCEESRIEHLKLAVSNPDDANPSIATIEIYPVPTLDALFFIYSPGNILHDVIAFRDKRFVRVNRNGKTVEHIDRLNSYLMEHLANVMPEASTKIYKEDDEQQDKLKQKDLQIQQLRDRNRVDKNTIQSLRNQMKTLRAQKTRDRLK